MNGPGEHAGVLGMQQYLERQMYRYKALGSAALLASGLLVANAQATEIVRWVDEHGVTHFTERHLAQAPATRNRRSTGQFHATSGVQRPGAARLSQRDQESGQEKQGRLARPQYGSAQPLLRFFSTCASRPARAHRTSETVPIPIHRGESSGSHRQRVWRRSPFRLWRCVAPHRSGCYR